MNFLLGGILFVSALIWACCELASGFSRIAFAYAIIWPLLFFSCMIIGLLIEMNWQWQKMLALYPNAFGVIFCGLVASWVIPIISRLENTPEKGKKNQN